MRIVDCYYISGNGKDSKCYKIHGVGIGYNVAKAYVYGKGIMAASGFISLPPLVVALGISITGGVIKKII